MTTVNVPSSSPTIVKNDWKENIMFLNVCHDEFTDRLCDVLKMEPCYYKGSTDGTDKFNSGETMIKEIRHSFRGKTVYLVAAVGYFVDHDIMKIKLLAYAALAAKAKQVNLIIPSFPYARQDRKTRSREAISAALVAHELQEIGIKRIITFDLHNSTIGGFFWPRDTTIDNLTTRSLMRQYVDNIVKEMKLTCDDVCIISPDMGGAKRAKKLALSDKKHPFNLAIIFKERKEAGKIASMQILGEENVKGKVAFIVDDMVDTAGTLSKAASLVMKSGAIKVYAIVTHPILSKNGCENINDSCLEKLVAFDTVRLNDHVITSMLVNGEKTSVIKPVDKRKLCGDKLEIISTAPLLAEAVRRQECGESFGPLYYAIYEEEDMDDEKDNEKVFSELRSSLKKSKSKTVLSASVASLEELGDNDYDVDS